MVSDLEILREVVSALQKGTPVVLCTVVEKIGSAPRDKGAKLLVTRDRVLGTLGGGDFERLVVKHAQEALREGNSRLIKYTFHEKETPGAVKTGHFCGGEVSVFLDVLNPSRRIILIGSGHISHAISEFAKLLGFKILIVDDNPETAMKERFPLADEIRVGDLVEMLIEIDPRKEDFILIAHGDTEKEYRVLSKLTEYRVRYIGILGSKKKGINMLRRLKEEGYNLSNLSEVLHVPVGINIGSDTPEEIAVSIVAEIIAKLKGTKAPFLSIADEVIAKLEGEAK